MRRFSAVLLAVGVLVAGGSAAWAGFFLQGARKAKSDPAETIVKYSVQPCVMISDGTSAGALDAEYWLFEDSGRLALYERTAPGDGSIIENHWLAEDGDHFFVWVRGSHGWEYVIPEDRSQEAVRPVYPKGTYKGKKDEQKVTSPVGDPAAKCVLEVKSAS